MKPSWIFGISKLKKRIDNHLLRGLNFLSKLKKQIQIDNHLLRGRKFSLWNLHEFLEFQNWRNELTIICFGGWISFRDWRTKLKHKIPLDSRKEDVIFVWTIMVPCRLPGTGAAPPCIDSVQCLHLTENLFEHILNNMGFSGAYLCTMLCVCVPHLPVPYIFGTKGLVTLYIGNWELGSKYIGNERKIRVCVCLMLNRGVATTITSVSFFKSRQSKTQVQELPGSKTVRKLRPTLKKKQVSHV